MCDTGTARDGRNPFPPAEYAAGGRLRATQSLLRRACCSAMRWALFLMLAPGYVMQIPCTTHGEGVSIIPNILPNPIELILGSLLS